MPWFFVRYDGLTHWLHDSMAVNLEILSRYSNTQAMEIVLAFGVPLFYNNLPTTKDKDPIIKLKLKMRFFDLQNF